MYVEGASLFMVECEIRNCQAIAVGSYASGVGGALMVMDTDGIYYSLLTTYYVLRNT